MSDIYKIGVAIMLTQNGVAPALSLISHQLLGVHRSVNQINAGFGRWRTALIGATGVMVGSTLLGGLAKIASYGEKFLDQQAKLKQLGLTNQQIAEATAKAWELTRTVPGTTVAGNLKTMGEMFNPVGFEHSLAMSKKMAQLDQVLHLVTGKEGSAYTTVKAGELMGVFTDAKTKQFDASGFDRFMDVVGRSAIASHGQVTPAMWLAFAKQAGPGASNLSEDGMMAAMEIMQGMGGFRAGTAMQALNRQFAGGVMAQRVAKELERVGIAQPGDLEVKKGGQVVAKNGAMKDLAAGLMNNPITAIVDMVLPKLIAAGFDTNEKLSGEIYRIAGTGPAQRLLYEIMRNSGQMGASIERSKLAMPLDQGLNALNTGSPIAAKGAVEAAFGNMMTALGSEALRAAIPFMMAATTFFNNVGKIAIAHPTAMKIIGEGLAAIGVVLVGAGGVAILAAIGPVGWIALGIGALGVAIVNFKSIWAWLVSAFEHLFGKSSPVSGAAGAAANTNAPVEGEGGAAFGIYHPFRRSVVAPGGSGDKTVVQGTVLMDGAKVGDIVAGHIADSAGNTIQGPAYFDNTRGATSLDNSRANP